jgi:hypothetical protein
MSSRPTRRAPAHDAATRVLLFASLAVCVFPGTARGDTLTAPGVIAFSHEGVDRTRLRRTVNRASADVAMVDGFVGGGGELPTLRLHVYASLESKGLATGYTLPAHAFSARNEVHAAVEDGFEGEMSVEIATIVLRRRLGRPRTGALEEGLAALLIGDWRGRGALYWASRLAALDDVRRVEPVADNRAFREHSALVARSLAAGFVAFLLDRLGKDRFLEVYASWEPGETGLDGDWARYVDGLRARAARAGPAPASMAEPPAFQRGFCLAHEGYQIHNGYLSRKSDEALGKLASLGTNAVSITPFTYMPSPHRPSRFPFSSGAGSENDEGVVHAVLSAKRLGMCVMLKPHVWLRGGWPGQVEMKNDADWDAFFEHYYEWMRHYALLAEMYDVDVLCIGVELGLTTRSQPARWADLIARLRTVYRGGLTYAANWGEEFEQISLWPALDYIGVNCYYPLSASETASDAELVDGVDAALSKIDAVAARFARPVIITEVGFTSAPAPWIAPHERRRGGAVDGAAQARCYEVFFRRLVGRPACAGVYWWKWPTFLEYGGPHDAGFTPNGKPAEDVVRRWYGTVLAN